MHFCTALTILCACCIKWFKPSSASLFIQHVRFPQLDHIFRYFVFNQIKVGLRILTLTPIAFFNSSFQLILLGIGYNSNDWEDMWGGPSGRAPTFTSIPGNMSRVFIYFEKKSLPIVPPQGGIQSGNYNPHRSKS